jgi:hypothetical protein
MNAEEHHDDFQDVETCSKVASALKRRLFKIGESLNVEGGDHINDGQAAIICAIYAQNVEKMLQKMLTARRAATRKRLS